jgi:hopene-associated glycosyltransferase HpnB
VSLTAWTYLVFCRAGFWQIREETPVRANQPRTHSKVVVLIPARDEAAVIGQAVMSLLMQNYAGRIDVLVIDDNSSDATREVTLQAAKAVQAADRLQVVSASPPPPGWTGKLWALSEGLRHAGVFAADYFLLTDADIVHSPENVSELIARAESDNFELVSLMVKLCCESPAERALIPAFLFFFFMLYPPAWVGQSESKTAAAAGGCILIRPSALARIGGLSAIRDELIDDCALAMRVKKTGGRIYLGATTHSRSLRAYGRWSDIEQMIARTAFTQLRHSTALLIGTLCAMAIIFIAPPCLLFAGLLPFYMGAASWLLMSICFRPSLRLYKISALWAPALPAAALFYLAATIHSAVLYWRGRGGVWKGRIQDPSAA